MRYIAPCTAGCYAGGERDFSFFAVPMDFQPLTSEFEEGLQKDETEVAAGAVAAEDDVVWGDGLVEGSWWWVEEGEVGN